MGGSLLAVRPKQTQSMHTRDGVRLDADVYWPDAPGPFPVLLMRQPYGRAIASTVVYAHPTWYAAHGYIVVIQDVRGRGSSDGTFQLFADEIADGFDTLDWVAQLPQSSGAIGMYGFSYQGMTQLYAAATRHPALKTICPAMVAYDLYADWAYEGGAFCTQLNLGWATQLAAETARRKGDRPAYSTLYTAARHLDLSDPVNPHSALLQQLAPESFYHQWLEQSDPDDPYWPALSPETHLMAVDLPMLHIGGWFDTYLRGTMALYRAIAPRSQYPQHLWVGPWGHLPWSRRTGAVDYGAAASSPIDDAQIRWFNQFLKGADTGLLAEPPVRWFEMGSNHWRSLPQYPPAPTQTFYLHSNGLAGMGDRHGQLIPTATSDLDLEAIPDTIVHDPWRPVPAVGGHSSIPSGSFDRAAIDGRSDVVTYTTAPLDAPLSLAGDARVVVQCEADAPSFDLCAVLSEVFPDGRVMAFSQGYRRVEAGAIPDVEPKGWAIALQPTCIQLAPGHALRLSLSAACFPAYAVNGGGGDRPSDSRLIDARIITLTLKTGREGTHLSLPVRTERP